MLRRVLESNNNNKYIYLVANVKMEKFALTWQEELFGGVGISVDKEEGGDKRLGVCVGVCDRRNIHSSCGLNSLSAVSGTDIIWPPTTLCRRSTFIIEIQKGERERERLEDMG